MLNNLYLVHSFKDLTLTEFIEENACFWSSMSSQIENQTNDLGFLYSGISYYEY